jgi:tuftelin-interacting protein 11
MSDSSESYQSSDEEVEGFEKRQFVPQKRKSQSDEDQQDDDSSSAPSSPPARHIQDEESEDQSEEDERPSFGGLGSKPIEPMQQQPQRKPTPQMPTQFGRPMLGTQSSSAPIQLDSNFASFEKYSKGIGSKLLMKMGYKPGQGLGSDGKGIVKPIDVKLRPAGMGLGHGGFDERTEAIKVEKAKKFGEEEDVGASTTVTLKPTRWKKTMSKKRKPMYKTATELIQEQGNRSLFTLK